MVGKGGSKVPRGLVLADSGEEIVIEVFENERFVPTYGWSSPTSFISSDRAHFSDETGNVGVSNIDSLDELEKPDIGGVLEWIDDWWTLDKSFDVGCDQNGWSYALEWYFLSRGHIEAQDLSYSSQCFVRRRRWLRRLRRLSHTELLDRQARVAASKGAEVTLVLKGEHNHSLGVSLKYHDEEKCVCLHRWQNSQGGGVGILRKALCDFKLHHPNAVFHPTLGDLVVAINNVNMIGQPFKPAIETVRDEGERGLRTITLKRPGKVQVEDQDSLEVPLPKPIASTRTRPSDYSSTLSSQQPLHKIPSVSDWMASRTGSGLKASSMSKLQGRKEVSVGSFDSSELLTGKKSSDELDIQNQTNPNSSDKDVKKSRNESQFEPSCDVVDSDSEEYFEKAPPQQELSLVLPSVLPSLPSVEFSSISELMSAISTHVGQEVSKQLRGQSAVSLVRDEFESVSSSSEEESEAPVELKEKEDKKTSAGDFFGLLSPFGVASQSDVDATPSRPDTPPLPVQEMKAAMLLNHAPLVIRPKNTTRSVRFADQLEEVHYFDKAAFETSEGEGGDDTEESDDREESDEDVKTLHDRPVERPVLIEGRTSEFV